MTKVIAGHTAPNFSLTGVDGRPFSLQGALERGPAILAFFKISCPVCQFTFPFLERILGMFKSDAVTFLGISQDDARDTKDFNEEYGVTFPSLIDADHFRVSNDYGLTTVPTVLLVAPDGKVQVSFTGFEKRGLEKISALLAKQFGKQVLPLFRPGEIVPDYKPG
jgi:peroxiredoxin